jgi:hypothetical protein
MLDGHNLWVCKPNDFNRGRGVNLFNTLEQLRKLIHDYTLGVEVTHQAKVDFNNSTTTA